MRDAARAQRLEHARDVRARAHEHGALLPRHTLARARLEVVHEHRGLELLRAACGSLVARVGRGGERVPGDPEFQRGGGRGIRAIRFERLELRLQPGLGGHARSDPVRDGGEHGGGRAVVARELFGLGAESLEEVLVGREVGAAPGVDRLLGVAHEEQRGPGCGVALERQRLDQFALQRIGVLEFIDAQVADLGLQRAAHARVAQELARFAQEVLEAEHVGRAQTRTHQAEQRRQELARVFEELRAFVEPDAQLCVQHGAGGRRQRLGATEQLELGLAELAAAPLGEFLQQVLRAERLRAGDPVLQFLRRAAAEAAQGLGELHEHGVRRPGVVARAVEGCERCKRRRERAAELLLPARDPGCVVARRGEIGFARAFGAQAQQHRSEVLRCHVLAEELGPTRIELAREHVRERFLDQLAHDALALPAVGVDAEARLQSGLERKARQQAASEGVDRDGDRLLECVAQRGGALDCLERQLRERQPLRRHAAGERGECLRQALVHLRRGGLGERDRDAAAQRRARVDPTRPDEPGDEARDERRGLARPRAGFERDRPVELRARAVACLAVAAHAGSPCGARFKRQMPCMAPRKPLC